MGAYEAEKKYKKNLEALKSEIEERNKEIEGLKKEVKDGHDRFHHLDSERKRLEDKLVAIPSKPPRETRREAKAYGEAQDLAQVQKELAFVQRENEKLRKTIDVTLKLETGRLATEKEALEERLREANEEKARLQGQFDRLVGQPTDAAGKREALELSKQMKIKELEQRLEESEASKAELQEDLYKADEKLLDLKFEKETFDLQYARLQKRIRELE